MIHVITACSRPNNLDALFFSIEQELGSERNWHIVLDGLALTEEECTRVIEHYAEIPWIFITVFTDTTLSRAGGQSLKNLALQGKEFAPDDWIYFLDDDTIVHPHLWTQLVQAERFDILLGQQDLGTHVRTDIIPRMTFMDQGQYVIRQRVRDQDTIPEHYCGDGEFIEHLCKKTLMIKRVKTPISYYNKLRW